MSIKDITIVITSFKSEKKIRSCLNSIDKQYKVINVENSNDQDYKEKIESEFKNVKCILTGGNLGYARANNIGIKNSKIQMFGWSKCLSCAFGTFGGICLRTEPPNAPANQCGGLAVSGRPLHALT